MSEERWGPPFCEACEIYFYSVEDVLAHIEKHATTPDNPVRLSFERLPDVEQN